MNLLFNSIPLFIEICKSSDLQTVRIFKEKDLHVNDGSSPKKDYGYLSFRENHKWLVSGLISSEIASTEKDLSSLIYQIAENGLGIDDTLSISVEIVSPLFSYVSNSEEEDRFYKGPLKERW